ncbi:hypothetical protein B0T26DRAFT_752805 [Lasiosphaeria miniovina]|uniref:CCCH zinc finger domain protein n=1 Tax=Lasiosphaeria miniovina TaxID=1954250 RepID=A0AA40ABH5_9PEZI|nr:uncharacterized protein B0T26DRAFT_752805 [Lasiosphaeria miniovina]KAK0712588.1 hypothetical protein B0T26DRAFT_752805 [Lasiosphaeria miniovina]
MGARHPDPAPPYNLRAETIVTDLTTELPPWILSCYGPGRDAPEQLFGGYPLEQSFEEIRLHYTQAAMSGNPQTALNEIEGLYQNARQQIQHTTSNVGAAIQFVMDGANKHPNRIDICRQGTQVGAATGEFGKDKPRAAGAFGAPANSFQNAAPTSNVFGAPTGPAAGGGGFGQPAVMGSKPNPFGAPAFGQPAQPPAQSAFGQPAQPAQSAFGQPVPLGGTSAFGQPAQVTSAFGQTPALGVKPNPFGAPAFGQPAQPAAGSTFGQPSGTAFGQASLPGQASGGSAFGQPAFGQAAQPSSAFRQPAQIGVKANPFGAPAAGAFGNTPPAAASNVFGQPAQQAATPFGQPAQPTPASNPFGQPAAPNNTPASNPFGQPAAAPTNNPFGQPTLPSASPFGAVANGTPNAGAFGQPAAITSVFGAQGAQASAAQPAANAFGQPAAPAPDASAFGGGGFSSGAAPATSAPKAAQGQGPYAAGATRQHPDVNSYSSKGPDGRLRMFKGKSVTYQALRGGDKPVPVLRNFNGTVTKVWFPDGAPNYTTETEAVNPEATYRDPVVQQQWKGFLETGKFEAGLMPEVPPSREYCTWDF